MCDKQTNKQLSMLTRARASQMDVRPTTTPVIEYIAGLEKQLSAKQLKDVDTLIDSIKRHNDSMIASKSLKELLLMQKNTSYEILADHAHKAMPEVPKDIFRRKLHLKFNGIRARLEQRIGLLKWKKKQGESDSDDDSDILFNIDKHTATAAPDSSIAASASEQSASPSTSSKAVTPHFAMDIATESVKPSRVSVGTNAAKPSCASVGT
jgi:hypothetical protein